MELYSESKSYKLYNGNMLDMLEVIEPNSIGSIVTDPPYELNFMGKGWDNTGIAFQKETWEKCYEVLKPGGYLLAFGGSRTFHRIACAIEDAGFEIRDTIMWIYGSGFPKSMNIGLAIDKKNGVKSTDKWDGWGTSLKPSFEPIIVARKPFKGSLVDNVIKNGVGGLNIDECRVPLTDNEPDSRVGTAEVMHTAGDKMWYGENGYAGRDVKVYKDNGRFPANTILTYDETDDDEVCSGFPRSKGASSQNNYSNGHIYRGQSLQESTTSLEGHRDWYNDDGSASRYFYCAKASKKDRDEGLDEFEIKANVHPTVKPTTLIQYLIKLVTPKGETVLDPFNGSGSTGKATMFENRDRNAGYKYIGIELTNEYLPISQARIEWASSVVINEDNKKSNNKKVVEDVITKENDLW